MRLLPCGCRELLPDLLWRRPEDGPGALNSRTPYDDGGQTDPQRTGNDAEVGELAPTVVFARRRPALAAKWSAPPSERGLGRACGGETGDDSAGVPLVMSSWSRGCLRASLRNRCAPATGGAGDRWMASSDGFDAISSSALFHAAGSWADTTLSDGARASALAKRLALVLDWPGAAAVG